MLSWNPYWTKEVIIESGGRYPLLLNRFHDHLEEWLIKAIVSTVDRLRYISYCCWIIGDIQKSLDCKNFNEFREAFIRRESALAIGTYINKPTTSLGNYTTYGEVIMSTRIDKNFQTQDCSFSLLKNRLGAFGQYYSGTLFNWGLIEYDEADVIHLTEIGNELYQIMELIYNNCEYYQKYKGERIVPTNVLKNWAEINEFDNIRDEIHKPERDFYKEIIFHLDVVKANDFRRDTLRIYLDCIMECSKHDIQFSESVFSEFLYYGKLFLPDEQKFVDVNLSDKLSDALFYWKVYEIQAHFRWWISEFFRLLLRRLQSSSTGMTMSEIIQSIDKDSVNELIAVLTNKNEDYFNYTFDQLYSTIHQINCSDEDFIESKLLEYRPKNLSQVSGALLIAISLIYDKYLEIKEDSRYFNLIGNLSNDYWFNEFVLNINTVRNYDISKLLEHIILNFIFDKHNRAMYEKKDLRRCWFTKSSDKYQYHADSTSIWRPAKHRNICNMLFDMNLINIDSESFVISNEGKTLYNLLKEKYYHE